MKHLKRLASLALALVMALALAVPGFAAEGDVKLTAPDKADHSFLAYQIFTAELDGTGGSMKNFKWGAHVSGNESAFIENLKMQETEYRKTLTNTTSFAECLKGLTAASAADDVANAIAKAMNVYGEANAAKIVSEAMKPLITSGGYPITTAGTDLPIGYYIIQDTKSLGNNQTSTSYYLHRLTGNWTIVVKEGKPEMTKKIKDADGNWQDAADYPVGTQIPFQITITLPENYGDPSMNGKYQLTISDEQGLGLGAPSGLTVKAYQNVEGQEDPTEIELVGNSVDYTYTETAATTDKGYSFTIDIPNALGQGSKIKDLKGGDTIVVSYTAELLETASRGLDGNVNEAKLTYKENDGDPHEIEDKVTAFTFDFDASKVIGGTTTPLTGAAFKLEKLLTAEEYTKLSDADKANVVTEGNNYWMLVKDYTKTEDGKTPQEANKDNASTFNFDGLGAGRYRLTETVAPDTYNKLEAPIYFAIVPEYPTTSDDPKLASLTIVKQDADGNTLKKTENGVEVDDTLPGNVSTGTVGMNVENFSGAVLPETGGIGTTIFYILGGVLLVGAVVLLIAKRRTSAEEE